MHVVSWLQLARSPHQHFWCVTLYVQLTLQLLRWPHISGCWCCVRPGLPSHQEECLPQQAGFKHLVQPYGPEVERLRLFVRVGLSRPLVFLTPSDKGVAMLALCHSPPPARLACDSSWSTLPRVARDHYMPGVRWEWLARPQGSKVLGSGDYAVQDAGGVWCLRCCCHMPWVRWDSDGSRCTQ
jgi:hypothetical protein